MLQKIYSRVGTKSIFRSSQVSSTFSFFPCFLRIPDSQFLTSGVTDFRFARKILIDECKKIKPDFIQNGNPVEGYITNGIGKGVIVKLSDGKTAAADNFVGSVGIWSAVRAQMYGE